LKSEKKASSVDEPITDKVQWLSSLYIKFPSSADRVTRRAKLKAATKTEIYQQ